jgi:hypothetical protein
MTESRQLNKSADISQQESNRASRSLSILLKGKKQELSSNSDGNPKQN